MKRSRMSNLAVCTTSAALMLALATPALPSTITIQNADGAGEGFNDPTVVAPVGGNPGVTLGAQRLNALQYAADIWGALLGSDVEIRLWAQFNGLGGTEFSALLGSAGPLFAYRDFPGAPVAATWYTDALADALAGSNQGVGANPDIAAEFNSDVDGDTVLGTTHWYYGFDSTPGGDMDFVTTALHEVGHGLGFLTMIENDGVKLEGFDDAYMLHLEDHSTGKMFPAMSNAERATAIVDDGDLHFAGANVVAASGAPGGCVHASGHVGMYAPNPYRPGSSTSHFDTTCSADELMEPFDTGAKQDVGLALPLLLDLGWKHPCENGQIDPGEVCDDGNDDEGDGCDSDCQVEECWNCDGGEPTTCNPLTGPVCDDGLTCTTDDTCDAGVCVATWNPVDCALDHFKLYKAKSAKKSIKFIARQVNLVDQFEDKETDVRKPAFLGNPVDKQSEGVDVPEIHLECYKIKDTKTDPRQPKFVKRQVETGNQFGTETLEVSKPAALCVPSVKDEVVPPDELPTHQVDHFKCYKAKTAKGTEKFVQQQVQLVDQFEDKETVVSRPAMLCNPVDKDGEGTHFLDSHLECYKIKDLKTEPKQAKFEKADVYVENQFGEEKLTASKAALLCVPSTKTEL